MKKNIVYLLVCLSLLLSSCGDNDDDRPATVTGRTVLVYIAADNNLGTQGFAASDIAEMVRGIEKVDIQKNNLLVYYDDGRNAQLLNITKDKSGKGIKEIVKEYDSRNSVGVTEMKEIFSLVFSRYQADSYGIAFWSHGEGWIPKQEGTRWFGQDGSNHMDIYELSKALSIAPHFEFIFFDACYMQSIEVAYELKDYCNYFVSSPTEIPGPGAPYQVVVPAMFKESGAAVATAQAYFDYYNNIYTGVYPWSGEWGGGVSVSVITSNKLDQLAEETAKILPKYIIDGASINVSDVLCYDTRSWNKYYYDLDGLIKTLTNENEDYDKWNESFEATLPYYKTTEKNYSQFTRMFSMEGFRGVSTYIPRANSGFLNSHYSTFKWYTKAGWDKTGW